MYVHVDWGRLTLISIARAHGNDNKQLSDVETVAMYEIIDDSRVSKLNDT